MGETGSTKRGAAKPVKNLGNQADDDDDDSRAQPKKGTRAETSIIEGVEAMFHKLGFHSNSRIVVDRSQEIAMETAASSSSSDDEDGGDEDFGEQEEINTTLSAEDTALFAELMQVIKKGGELKKLRVDHLKSYLRYHGLRISGLKDVLVSRIEQHLKIKDGQGEAMYPKSSFTINCTGDVCLGDTVLFSQHVYEKYDITKRSSGPPLGLRTVAGKVVNESYGAGKQQHTFTIEVLWSTGFQPFYVMRPLQIKGRNLYRINTRRQKWDNEDDREKVLAEKHARGEEARAKRRAAKELRASTRSRPRARAQSKTRPYEGESSTHSIAPSSRSIAPPSRSIAPSSGSIAPSSRSIAPSSRSIAPPSSSQAVFPSRNMLPRGSYTPAGQYMRDENGTPHMRCSNRGCDKAGAWQCVTQSCSYCCYRNSAARGKCPRHL